MKLRTIKKEISFLTGEIISNCYMALYFQGDKTEKPLADVIQKAVEAHNSLIERANHPAEKHNARLTRKHYAALRNDMIESADTLFTQISTICSK